MRNVSEKLEEKTENIKLNSVNSRTKKNNEFVNTCWLKIIKYFMRLIFFCVYKMYLISVEEYKNSGVEEE